MNPRTDYPSSHALEITIFEKPEGILSKTITPAADGSLVSDGSACRMSSGCAKRMPLPNGAESLAELLANMESNQAVSLGRLVSAIGESAAVTTVSRLTSAPNGTIARTRDFLEFRPGAPAFMLLDIDRKGMPRAVTDRINAAGGVVPLLTELFPELIEAGRVERTSTSAGIYNAETDQTFAGSGGQHIYVLVENGADIPRALEALHERLWLNSCGWLHVGAAGQVLDRSIVDASVGSPERLVFEGAPMIEPPLTQARAARRPIVTLGVAVDTRRAFLPLSEVERGRLEQIRAAERRKMTGEVAAKREAADRKFAQEIADRDGIPLEKAERQVRARHEGVLMPAMSLVMDDDEMGTITVRDVLENPDLFIGETLADPLEGPSYGRCKAMVMRDRYTGGLSIHSFAHGGARYRLCYDRTLLEDELRTADPDQVLEIFLAKDAQSHLQADDDVRLIKLVGEISRLGKWAVKKRLKDERDRRSRAAQAASNELRSISSRLILPAPENDAELTPVMQQLDEVLVQVGGEQPPMRGLSGALIEIRKSPPPGLHTLTSESADPDQREDQADIPPPPEPLMHDLNTAETSMLVEEYIEFQKRDQFGALTAVRLPTVFLNAYRTLHGSKLPVCVAISTSPFVSPVTGEVIAGVGFDRDPRIFHEIEPALLQSVPDRAKITDEQAMAAYRFLADEWLVDVKTNAEGKAIAIAAALTTIQRIALDQRPAFFIVAGQRGGGKTTLAALIALATLGRRPAAASWASNEDERRKALLSHLRTGAASIVWDNIPRGALIKCPHLERALTSSEYSDRVLGVSEQVTVPSLTVMLFTGNNIAPAGDMASRALVCSIDVDRPDPENRTFVHPDPVGWTLNNRRRIMEALYTLLLWNPHLRLPEPERPEPKTRFKTWWKSIGAPIEAVTGLIGAPVDFGALFAANEVGDEETDGVAIICDVVHRQFGTQVFSVKDLGNLLNAGPEPVIGTPADQAEWQARNDTASALREALQSIHDVPLPAGLLPNRRIGQILGKSVNRPVSVGGSTMRLRLVHKGHAGRTYQLEVL